MNRNVVDVKNDTTQNDIGYDSTPKHDNVSLKELFYFGEALITNLEKLYSSYLLLTDLSLDESQLSLTKADSTPREFPYFSISDLNMTQLSNELMINEHKYKELTSEIEEELISALKDFTIENDVFSRSEELIAQIANKYSLRFLGEVLSKIYIDYYNCQEVVCGICSSLERFDPEEVSPWGQSIVIGLINHKSDIVKERVISLIENWGDSSLLPCLKSIDISSTWMKEYVNSVIQYLEEEQCII